MYCEELDSCCSVQVIKELWGTVTAAEIKKEILNAVCDYDTGKGTINREYPRHFIATTNDQSQVEAGKALKEVGFVGKKFYGRHQSDYSKLTKYMTFWTLNKVPADVMKQARAIARANKRSHYGW